MCGSLASAEMVISPGLEKRPGGGGAFGQGTSYYILATWQLAFIYILIKTMFCNNYSKLSSFSTQIIDFWINSLWCSPYDDIQMYLFVYFSGDSSLSAYNIRQRKFILQSESFHNDMLCVQIVKVSHMTKIWMCCWIWPLFPHAYTRLRVGLRVGSLIVTGK